MSIMEEVYISIDIETDGPIPGKNSMLSLGAAAFLKNGKQIGSFYKKLNTLAGANSDQSTMDWWATKPEAWKEVCVDREPAESVMGQFVCWVKEFDYTPVAVCYPAGFDFTYLYWYMIAFEGKSPFSFSALDIKSYVSGYLGIPYRQATKRNMPKEWFSKKPHTHKAIDDAIEQGELFINILQSQNMSK